MTGIDISEWNGDIDFDKVKNHVDFIMIRATWGNKHKDKYYKIYADSCKKVGIPFGFYYYSYALNEDESKREVAYFLKAISEYKKDISFPLAIDMEDTDGYKAKNGFPTNEVLCNICKVACDEIGLSGYYPMIYASKDYFENKLNLDTVAKYNKWLAWWNSKAIDEVDKEKYQMLQYKSTGIIDGIKTKVDINKSFVEFHKLIAYINNLKKMQEIKLYTGIEDISIQYMSLYKHGNFLLDKIHERLTSNKKIKNKEQDIHKVVKEEYMLERRTIEYLEDYIYGESLFLKLYKAICLKERR